MLHPSETAFLSGGLHHRDKIWPSITFSLEELQDQKELLHSPGRQNHWTCRWEGLDHRCSSLSYSSLSVWNLLQKIYHLAFLIWQSYIFARSQYTSHFTQISFQYPLMQKYQLSLNGLFKWRGMQGEKTEEVFFVTYKLDQETAGWIKIFPKESVFSPNMKVKVFSCTCPINTVYTSPIEVSSTYLWCVRCVGSEVSVLMEENCFEHWGSVLGFTCYSRSHVPLLCPQSTCP